MSKIRNILHVTPVRNLANKAFQSKFSHEIKLNNAISGRYRFSRCYSTTSKPQNRPDEDHEPYLLRLPNPFLWMRMKWRFKKLNYFWDPDFNEVEFVRGSRQAVVTITHLIGENNFKELHGLLTKEALLKLRREVTLTWPELLKQNISLKHEHIKAVTPVNIRMMENLKIENRFCDIDLMFVALKKIMFKRKQNNRILVFNILSRFRRNYTNGAIPDWTVAIFTMDVAAYKPSAI